MDEILAFILNGATEFTPELIVRLVVFTLVLECIGSIAYSLTSVGRR